MSEYIVREIDCGLATNQEIVGELVRCKDCRYAYKQSFPYLASTFALDHYCAAYGFEVDDDFYCASGKRRGVTE